MDKKSPLDINSMRSLTLLMILDSGSLFKELEYRVLIL